MARFLGEYGPEAGGSQSAKLIHGSQQGSEPSVAQLAIERNRAVLDPKTGSAHYPPYRPDYSFEDLETAIHNNTGKSARDLLIQLCLKIPAAKHMAEDVLLPWQQPEERKTDTKRKVLETCAKCGDEYDEAENSEYACPYHPGILRHVAG